MVGIGSEINCIDNTGILRGRCIKVYNGFFYKTTGGVCEVILITPTRGKVKDAFIKVQKKVYPFLIVGVNRNRRRPTGHYINYTYNKGVVLKDKEELLANRIMRPVCRELRQTKFSKILLVGRKSI